MRIRIDRMRNRFIFSVDLVKGALIIGIPTHQIYLMTTKYYMATFKDVTTPEEQKKVLAVWGD